MVSADRGKPSAINLAFASSPLAEVNYIVDENHLSIFRPQSGHHLRLDIVEGLCAPHQNITGIA